MHSEFTGAWDIDEGDFPEYGPAAAILRFALRYAILAPSGHNGQPWRFEIHDDTVHVRADRSRALPTIDPLDREMLISCAATVHLTALALKHFGYAPTTSVLPDREDPDLLATLTLGEPGTRPDTDELFDAVLLRHSNRSHYESRPLPQNLVVRLEAAAHAEGAWLQPLTDRATIRAAADLIAIGDRIKWSEPVFRHELAERIIPNGGKRRDGMPGYAFGVPGPFAHLAPAVVRHLDIGRIRAASDRKLAIATPLLAVIGTEHDDAPAWMAAGAAMSHVLLQATADGLATSFLSQAIEVDDLRPQLGGLLGRTGHPQLLIRVGYSRHRASRPPRRPLQDVLGGPEDCDDVQLRRRPQQPRMEFR